ncbi:hypothetical protein [Nocardia xishanensis]|uniref:hypothetical protein n=1 Tax=Nocardia xishanensis TaxID=238964 RepID=UPI000B2A94F8|nr:hypothetical protein [Nocardia xishanensis]
MTEATRLPLSHKINRLFAVMHPRSAPERSTESVAEQVSGQLRRAVAASYLEELRGGRFDDEHDGAAVEFELLAAIASCFGVAPRYLTTTGQAAASIDRELELLATMRDANVASIALRGSDVDRAMLARLIRGTEDVAAGSSDLPR